MYIAFRILAVGGRKSVELAITSLCHFFSNLRLKQNWYDFNIFIFCIILTEGN